MLHDGEAGLSFRVGLRKNRIHYTQCKFLFDAAKWSSCTLCLRESGACCCTEEINNWQWTPWAVWCHALCARAIGLRWILWTRYCLVLNVSSLHPSLAARTTIYRYTTQDIARWYAVIPWSAAEIQWSHASGCSKYYRALNTCSFGCTKNLDELAGTLLCGQGLNAFNGPKGIQRVSEILDILWTKS